MVGQHRCREFSVLREIPKRTVVRIDFTFSDLGRPFYFGRATPLSRILRYTRNSEMHSCLYRFYFSELGRSSYFISVGQHRRREFSGSREIPKRTVVRIGFGFDFRLEFQFYHGRTTPPSRILRITRNSETHRCPYRFTLLISVTFPPDRQITTVEIRLELCVDVSGGKVSDEFQVLTQG